MQSNDNAQPEGTNWKERGLTRIVTAARAGGLAVRHAVENAADYLGSQHFRDELIDLSSFVIPLFAVAAAGASEVVFPGHGFFELAGSALQGLGNLAMHGVRFVEDLPTLEQSSDPATNANALKLWFAGGMVLSLYAAYVWLASGPHRRDDY